MSWIVLIGDENLNIDSIKRINHYGCRNTYTLQSKRCAIEYNKDYIHYDLVDNLLNYYDKNESTNIPFSNPHFILMSSSSKDIIKKVLRQDNFLKGVYVDPDDGDIVPIEKFIS